MDPIIACVGTTDQFKSDPDAEPKLFDPNMREPRIDNVDFYGNPAELKNKGFENNGEYTYVMSPISNKDKFSKEFFNCTGLVVTGQDKKTNENISFITHQNPEYFLRDTKESREAFLRDLRMRLEVLKRRSAEGTIDAVIVGGNYVKNAVGPMKNYLDSIRILAEEVRNELGFEPVVMTGPKVEGRGKRGGDDKIYYNNKKRRLYIVRPEVGDASTESFLPSDLKKQQKSGNN